MSYSAKLEIVQDQLHVLDKVFAEVSDDELAISHMVCPKIYDVYKKLRDTRDALMSQAMSLEDKLEEARREFEERRNEYRGHKYGL